MYLCDNVQRLVSVVSFAFIRLPVGLVQPVNTQVLEGRGVAIMWNSLSHGDVTTRPDGKLDPTEDWRVVTVDALTGDWQVGDQNQPGGA